MLLSIVEVMMIPREISMAQMLEMTRTTLLMLRICLLMTDAR